MPPFDSATTSQRLLMGSYSVLGSKNVLTVPPDAAQNEFIETVASVACVHLSKIR